MRAALRIEDIKSKDAHATGAKSRAWAARVHVNANGYIRREFLQPNATDYSEANSVGSRGVCKCYWLEEQAYYEVSAPQSWRNTDRYFCEVINGEIARMTKEEVQDAQARTGG